MPIDNKGRRGGFGKYAPSVRNWVLLPICLAILSGLTGSVYATRATKLYASTASMLPQLSRSPVGGAGASAGGSGSPSVVSQLIPLFAPVATGIEHFKTLAATRTFREEVVRALNLRERYIGMDESQIAEMLRQRIILNFGAEGLLTLTVEAEQPEWAAELANAIAEHLDLVARRLSTGEAARQREFIEKRLEETQLTLRAAEDRLKTFQEQAKVVGRDPSLVGVEIVARLRGEIINKEVELEVLRTYSTERNPDVIQMRKAIGELKQQLAQMEYERGRELPPSKNPGKPRREFRIPLSEVPEVSVTMGRFARDVRIQEEVFLLLTQQLEQAKIAEARDLPMVHLIDRARPDPRSVRPRVRAITLFSAMAGFAVGLGLTIGGEYLQRRR